jgi:predicted short-subunit dehydrogenase-like oxidoreductase (DUF2520 family)
MTMQKTLNIIGGGNVGKTLGRLWTMCQTFAVQDVLNRSAESGERAIAFIGTGRAVTDYADVRPADVTMITTTDGQIAASCAALATAGGLRPGAIVFHCSGALSASELQAAQAQGARTASMHPIRSFAAPEQVVQNFAGTACGAEGEPDALAELTAAFGAIGAQVVTIDPQYKVIYHAAAVFACNYLVTLLDVARQAYIKAGIPDDIALKLIEPLVRETMDNVFRLGPEAALTGPVARGDTATVVRQYRAVKQWDPGHGALYRRMGKLTAALARRRVREKPL